MRTLARAIEWRWILPIVLSSAMATAVSGGEMPTACLEDSGDAALRCLRRYIPPVVRCRDSADLACEEGVRAGGGPLAGALADTAAKGAAACTDSQAEALGYLGSADVALRVSDACMDFGEDFFDVALVADPTVLSPPLRYCQRVVALGARNLLRITARTYASRCFVERYESGSCDREGRDRIVSRARRRAARVIAYRCGSDFDALGLGRGDEATLAERIDALLAVIVDRGRHLAELVFPPNDLGPTAAFGPFAIGVRTLELADESRPNTTDTGPRPVLTEVYYPSTPDAVAGIPRDIVRVLGIDLVETPSYRDVALAPGRFPLILFSHGNGGIRFQSFFFAAHLASHGFIVATPDHHGNTFTEGLLGVVDGMSIVNRPLDMKFLIDELTSFDAEPGNFFDGAVDLDRIGMSGHSFGGLTTFALAGGPTVFGTFTEPRIKAIFPQAPASRVFVNDYFSAITVPTLIVGGSIDETTPFESDQRAQFEHLPSGASIVALAELKGGGHFTFSDFCEVPRNLLAFLGGFSEACEPRHLPWRHAHDIINYLSLNFFDATLNGNAEALERLRPENLAGIEDLVYRAK
jgi:predicted dienelactone hydrolase